MLAELVVPNKRMPLGLQVELIIPDVNRPLGLHVELVVSGGSKNPGMQADLVVPDSFRPLGLQVVVRIGRRYAVVLPRRASRQRIGVEVSSGSPLWLHNPSGIMVKGVD